jgi:hypothetical protein
MATTRSYRIRIDWMHKKLGPQSHQMRGEGSSARRALNRALRSFFSCKSPSDRKARRDAHVAFKANVCRIPT